MAPFFYWSQREQLSKVIQAYQLEQRQQGSFFPFPGPLGVSKAAIIIEIYWYVVGLLLMRLLLYGEWLLLSAEVSSGVRNIYKYTYLYIFVINLHSAAFRYKSKDA